MPRQPPRAARERPVTISFRHADQQQHCAGIQSLCVADSHLYTASRDSTVKRWMIAGKVPEFDTNFEGHCDWVNDVVLVGDYLLTCSSDTTVRLWRAFTPGNEACAFRYHSDYVMALAAAPKQAMVASVGLQGELHVWDIQVLTQAQISGQPFRPAGGRVKGQSLYAVAMDAAGMLVAAGGIDGAVHVYDLRAGAPAVSLTGHKDNVRSLQLSADGKLLASGSSDATIRLWDLGQQRTMHTITAHEDSVWALEAKDDFSQVLSGGRDGKVLRTDLRSLQCEELVQEPTGVRKLAACWEQGTVWVASEGTDVCCWPLPAKMGSSSFAAVVPGREPRGRPSLTLHRQGSTGGLDDDHVGGQSGASRALARIKGIPGIVRHTVMNDRRHILTQDSEGSCSLWDVTTGTVVANYGQVDFKAKVKELFEPVSVPAWFQSEHKLGVLSLQLDPQKCFAAETYASHLGWGNAHDESVKINYGYETLKGTFAKWAARVQMRAGTFAGAQPADMNGMLRKRRGPFRFCEGWPVAVASTSREGMPWHRLSTEFTGDERVHDILPSWVAETVLESRFPQHKELKQTFVLLPAPRSGLPALEQDRLTAPSILEVHKLAQYAKGKLQEVGIAAEVEQSIEPPPQHPRPSPVPAAEGTAAQKVLELLCNDVLVPPTMTLMSVRRFLNGGRSGDLVLQYRLRDPALGPPQWPEISPPDE